MQSNRTLWVIAISGCLAGCPAEDRLGIDRAAVTESGDIPLGALDGVGFGSGFGSGGCTSGRHALDWRPAPGELDGRDWTSVDLAVSADDPDVYPWVRTVAGPIDQVRLAPPNFYGTPAYEYASDYDATIDDCYGSSTVHAWFLPGIYTAEISYRDGRPAELFTVFAGTTFNGPSQGMPEIVDGGGSASDFAIGAASGSGDGNGDKEKDPNCLKFPQYSQIPWDQLPYDAGAFIIEDPESDNNYISRSAEIMDDRAVRAGDVATAANKIVDAYNAKGSALNLVMVGHGANTSLAVGAGQGGTEGKYLWMTGTKSNQNFLAKVSAGGTQRVQRIGLVGCCIAGRIRELINSHLMCDLAHGLAPGNTVTEILGFQSYTNNVVPAKKRDGYFTVSGSTWQLNTMIIKKGHCDSWQAEKDRQK